MTPALALAPNPRILNRVAYPCASIPVEDTFPHQSPGSLTGLHANGSVSATANAVGPPGLNWYALYVRTGFETLVADRLNNWAHFDAFFPSFKHKDRFLRRVVRKAFFPGYVFARFPLERHGLALALPHVLRIVGYGEPTPLKASEVESVRIVGQLPRATAVQGHVQKGDKVIIRCGPLAGVEAEVEYRKGKARVVVMVDPLGQALRAEVDINWLRAEPKEK